MKQASEEIMVLGEKTLVHKVEILLAGIDGLF